MVAFVGFPRDGHEYSGTEVGLALSGFIERTSNGLPKTGMLGVAPNVTAVGSSWRCRVDRFVYVHQVDGAIQLSGISTPEEVEITPAVENIPAGQTRIDRIAWDPDAAELVVIEGTPAASPATPGLSGFAPVGTVRVNAGDGQTVGSQVTKNGAVTNFPGREVRVAQGTVSKRAVKAGGVTNVKVNFPAGRFTKAPNVQVTPWGDARDTGAHVDAISASGCTIRLGSTSTVRRSIGAQWRAEQI